MQLCKLIGTIHIQTAIKAINLRESKGGMNGKGWGRKEKGKMVSWHFNFKRLKKLKDEGINEHIMN